MSAPQVDVYIENENTVFTFEPVTDAARRWVDENVNPEAWRWLGSRFCVDPRFAFDLVVDMQRDGLVVQ